MGGRGGERKGGGDETLYGVGDGDGLSVLGLFQDPSRVASSHLGLDRMRHW